MSVLDVEEMTDDELLERVAAMDAEQSDLPELARDALDGGGQS